MTAALAAFQGLPPLPADIWFRWNGEPLVWLTLGLAALFYSLGVRWLWKRVGYGQALRPWQIGAFGLGLAALFVAFISPLNALSGALFSAHMLQHLLLTLVAPPLLALGRPLGPFLWALPKPARRAVIRGGRCAPLLQASWRILTMPLPVWALYALALWVWHLPVLYQTALEHRWVHELEHLSFFGTAWLFWWILLHPGRLRRLEGGGGILFVFTTALHSGALGALLTFARSPLYPVYTSSVLAWGLIPLADQQLAGLIMWIPAGVIYLLVALLLFGRWLQQVEQSASQSESLVSQPQTAPR